MLLHAGASDLDGPSFLLANDIDMEKARDQVGLGGCEGDPHPPDFLWFNTERAWFDLQAPTFLCVDVELDVACHPSLVLELDLLVLGGLDWHEPEVHERLKLDIWSGSEGVQEQLELLIVTLGLDLDDIVEVALRVGLERNVHLDGKTRGERALHVVLDLELGSFGAGKLEPPHSFADVPDGNGHLVVLVWLDI